MNRVVCALLVGVHADLSAAHLAWTAARRWYVAAGCLSLLAVLVLAGCRPAPTTTVVATAPVDASLSFYQFIPPCLACSDTVQYGLAAYSVRDGSTRWTNTPPAPGFLPDILVYHAGMLFAFTWQEGDAHHATLTAIRAANGKPLWHVGVQGFPPPMAVAGDYVAVETQTDSPTLSAHLLVFRAADGTQLHDIILRSRGSMVADSNGAYLCSDDGLLSAFQLSDGQLSWTIPVVSGAPTTTFEGSCVARPVDGTLYYVAPSPPFARVPTGLVAMRERDGHMLWHQPLLGILPDGRDGMLLAAIPSNRPGAARYDTDVAAFRASDGTLLWRIAGGPPEGAPIVKSGPAVVYASGTSLVAVRATDGAPFWRREQPHRAFIPLAATDSVVFAESSATFSPRATPPPGVDPNTYLVALRPNDGSLDWQMPLDYASVLVTGAQP